jgi:Arc/MetJ-type ribon-helix-helix transcriptional regulator
MASTKRKAVINAEGSQIDRVQQLIDAGAYRTLSEFVREAVEEKLARLHLDRVAEAVESYCAAGYADEDGDLVAKQAFDGERKQTRKRSRRAPG